MTTKPRKPVRFRVTKKVSVASGRWYYVYANLNDLPCQPDGMYVEHIGTFRTGAKS